MDTAASVLTVYFEAPFWVGVWERIEDGRLSVCKVTFGAEPRDGQVYDWLQREYRHLRFGPAVAAAAAERPANPKRMQREARRQMERVGVGTRSQQALKLQQEQRKAERDTADRTKREEEQRRRFALKQQKRKEKHRGR